MLSTGGMLWACWWWERVGFCDTMGQGTDTPDWESVCSTITSRTTTMWMLLPAAWNRQIDSLPEDNERDFYL